MKSKKYIGRSFSHPALDSLEGAMRPLGREM
ncbi:TPA_asm: hypothetical protein [Porphyromonas phage phage025a_SJD11]|uniref:Uncharacterized protein n=1 Tax=Porphyromonas phage phage025a_SJD11 TaxID=3154115 RepID=A0AAT9JFE7_9CAUD